MPVITTDKTYNCAFEITIDVVGGKWKSLILWYLQENGTLRNGELLRLMPKITQKMLTQQLREMEAAGLVIRTVYEQVPPKVEYSLSASGKKLETILKLMKEWGTEYARERGYVNTCDKAV